MLEWVCGKIWEIVKWGESPPIISVACFVPDASPLCNSPTSKISSPHIMALSMLSRGAIYYPVLRMDQLLFMMFNVQSIMREEARLQSTSAYLLLISESNMGINMPYLQLFGTKDVQVCQCDIASGAFTHTLSGHRDGVMSLEWSTSSEWILVTGGCDGAIRFWDIRRAGCFLVLDQSQTQLGRRSLLLEIFFQKGMHPRDPLLIHLRKNPLILIHDKKISDLVSLVRLMELAVEKNSPLLVVAEDVENDSLAMLVLNKQQVGFKVCAIKAPGFGDNRRVNLEDLAILTRGEVITEDIGLSLDKVQIEMLGSAKKVTISTDDTIIICGGGKKKLIEERCEQLRTAAKTSKTVFDKEKANERLARLSGGVAVLKVAGASEAEVGERKDRVEDALHATRAAVEESIVPGGGVALLYAARELDKLQISNSDRKIGVQIIQNALKTPTFTIAANAGVDGAVVVSRLLE